MIGFGWGSARSVPEVKNPGITAFPSNSIPCEENVNDLIRFLRIGKTILFICPAIRTRNKNKSIKENRIFFRRKFITTRSYLIHCVFCFFNQFPILLCTLYQTIHMYLESALFRLSLTKGNTANDHKTQNQKYLLHIIKLAKKPRWFKSSDLNHR